jgi:hypothetical protein
LRQLVCRGRHRRNLVHHVWPAILVLTVGLAVGHAVRLSASGDDTPLEGGTAGAARLHKSYLPAIYRNEWTEAGSPFGIQVYSSLPETASKSAEAGAGWVRIPLRWASIERVNTTPENYRWSARLDAWLKQLAKRHIRVILTVSGNPAWAATYDAGVLDKTDPGELAEFLSAAVARYSVAPYKVTYWELYNEPDNGSADWADIGLGYWGNEPAAYAEMMATVYPRLKMANPNIKVVFGGLAYDFWTEEGGPFVEDFLDQVLQHGAGPYFDVMNFHYYPNYHAKWSPYGIGLAGKTNFLRAKLASFGLDKPIVCTETAAQSGTFPGGSDEEQSRFLVETMVRGVTSGLDAIIWFMLTDDSGYWKSGLLNLDLSPKPAFYAYQTLVDQLAAAGFVRTIAPGELGAVPVEGYAFSAPATATWILVAWSQDGLDHELSVVAPEVTIVDKYGAETIRNDGDDGAVDNQVQVVIGSSPLYLRFADTGLTSSEIMAGP